MSYGNDAFELANKLFPICRSITGPGVRKSLEIIRGILPDLTIHRVPTGTKVFDWTIPQEWIVEGASLTDPEGQIIADFMQSNLHILHYSHGIDKSVSLEDLYTQLYTIEDIPEAIPYVTSFYKRRWGFALEYKKYKNLTKGNYHAKINSKHIDGELNYGELIIPGQTKEEILFSANICHPSMANNELSGPCTLTFLARELANRPAGRYTYRILFLPETIGAITFLAKDLHYVRKNVKAGFVLTCCGDRAPLSLMPSKYGDTIADRVSDLVLSQRNPDYRRHSFLNRGSDERQFCNPGVELPVVSIMRSKYSEYKEYHTSLDDMTFICPNALHETIDFCIEVSNILEDNFKYRNRVIGEPHLSKYGLYPDQNARIADNFSEKVINILAYADGTNDLFDLAKWTKLPVSEIQEILNQLKINKIVEAQQ